MPFPSLGDLPDPGIESRSPALRADALTSEPLGHPFKDGTLEEAMAAHSSILAWRIPWAEEPGGLWSMESRRVGQD